MKVLFVDDVPNVAKVGQTKEVANGYARNFLFPRKLAVVADSQAAAALQAHLKKLMKQRAVEEAQMKDLAQKINGLQITLRAKVGENDKLYGSVTGADIAEALSKAAGCVIDKKHVALAEPIKMAGVCNVTIKFMHDITAVIKTCVIDENAEEATAVAEAEKKAADAAAAVAAAKAAELKKEKKVKAVKEEKPAEAAAVEEKPAKPAKEKKAKSEKPSADKPAKEEKAVEEPKAEVKAEKKAKSEKSSEDKSEVKVEKPAKEKKSKEEKPAKAEKVTAEKPAAEEKKEKKPRKSKKEDAAE